MIVRGVHWLVLSSPDDAATSRRQLQQLLNDPPVVVFGPVPHSWGNVKDSSTSKDPQNARVTKVSGGGFVNLRRTFSLTNDRIMHHGSHLLTLMRSSPHKLLVRVAHLFDDGEDSKSGVSTTEDLGGVLELFHCEGRPVELTLSGNQRLKDAEARRYKWSAGRNMSIHNGHEAESKEGKGSYSEMPDGKAELAVGENDESTASDGFKGSWHVHLNPMEVRTYEVDC